MSAKLFAVAAAFLFAGSAQAQTLYAGDGPFKTMTPVATLAAGPGGTLIGFGIYNGAVFNVILTPKSSSGGVTLFQANILTDNNVSTVLAGGLVTFNGTGFSGTGTGVITIKPLTSGTQFNFSVH